jgi:hypothetical protein
MRRSEAELREAIALMQQSLDAVDGHNDEDCPGVAASKFFAATVIDVVSWVLCEAGPTAVLNGGINATEELIRNTRTIFTDEPLPNSN